MANYISQDAWKCAMEIVKEAYQITKMFPKDELFGMTLQIRRAAILVPSNIAEGIGRNYRRETTKSLRFARGYLYELETLFTIAATVDLIDEDTVQRLSLRIEKCLHLINGLIRYFRN